MTRRETVPGVATHADHADAAPMWRCRKCDKPLDEPRRSRVHMRSRSGRIDHCPYPVTARCGVCGQANKIRGSSAP